MMRGEPFERLGSKSAIMEFNSAQDVSEPNVTKTLSLILPTAP